MLNVNHFREYIIRPTLDYLGLDADRQKAKAAENLLVGTAAQESRLTYLHQIGGPALGIYQIEMPTYNSIINDYLRYKENLHAKVDRLSSAMGNPEKELIGNLFYATAIARLIYYRHSDPLPAPDDIWGLANMYKKIFNTSKGAAKVEDFYMNYPDK